MFKYNPEDAISCLPDGEYTLAILKAEDTVSKAGNDMTVVTFEAFGDTRKGKVTEYIVNPVTLYKLKQIAKALGPAAVAQFDKGEFAPEEHIGDTLRAVLAVESDDFGDKNKVKKYLPANGTAPKPPAEDLSIPF